MCNYQTNRYLAIFLHKSLGTNLWAITHPVCLQTSDKASVAGVAILLPCQVWEGMEDLEGGSADSIHVPLHIMKYFFDSLIDQIRQAVQRCLDRAQAAGVSVDYMLIAGGFGGSPYLIQAMRDAFEHQLVKDVVCPGVPSQAVLKGQLGCAYLWHHEHVARVRNTAL